jgi:adenosylcobinamide kinase/adenosylcobinamide-phosphate guanylyltransferase
MMVLVIGPNGSGKSAAAEHLAHDLRGPDHDEPGVSFYVATMVAAADEGRQRIARHRRQRLGLGLTTIESPLAELGPDQGKHSPIDVILLEDVSNLVANLTFMARDLDPAAATLDRIARLRAACRHLITVTIGPLVPTPDYDADTLAYIATLDRVNQALRQTADRVIDTYVPKDPT